MVTEVNAFLTGKWELITIALSSCQLFSLSSEGIFLSVVYKLQVSAFFHNLFQKKWFHCIYQNILVAHLNLPKI